MNIIISIYNHLVIDNNITQFYNKAQDEYLKNQFFFTFVATYTVLSNIWSMLSDWIFCQEYWKYWKMYQVPLHVLLFFCYVYHVYSLSIYYPEENYNSCNCQCALVFNSKGEGNCNRYTKWIYKVTSQCDIW